MSNYYNSTLPNFAPVGYDEWLKKQNASKAASSAASNTLNSGTFKDSTSNSIREAAEKAASQNVAQSVNNGNYLFYDNIIPEGMKDGFTEYQHEQIIKDLEKGNQGSVITGGIPIAGFSPLLDSVAKKTSEEGKTIADLVTESQKNTGTKKNADTKKDTPDKAPAETITDTSDGLIGGIGYGGGGGYSYPGFQVSNAYTQAMDYTSSLLAQISTGRTSYSDQIDALIKEYQNREKFSYDASTDPLFQQMLAMSMNSGKMAMEDTIGQAAALTGGYGNTYGQAVGNAAYNQYIMDAYANLPDYYNLALDAYNMEGEQMLNELDILRDADNTEYGRLVNAYNANYNYASDMYDREYGSYMDALNQSNNDRNFYYGVQQDALAQQNWEKQFEYNASQDALAQQNWQTQFDYNAAQDAYDRVNKVGHDGLTDFERQAVQDIYRYNNANGNGTTVATQYLNAIGKGNVDVHSVLGLEAPIEYKEPTQTMYSKAMDAYATGGDAALMQYYESIPNYSVEDIDAYIGKYGVIETPELKTYTKTKDTKNGLGGIDRNDVVEDQYGNTFKLSELPTDVAKVLTDLKKGESYDFSTGKKVK